MCALLLTTATGIGGLSLPRLARADEVATAQARVDSLQQLAWDTTGKLVAGTRRWEADQSRLRRLQLASRASRRQVRQAGLQVAAGQRQVDGLSRQLYEQPLPSQLQVALTQRPEQVLSALQAQSGLNVVAGTQSDIVARAMSARHRLRTDEALAEQLVVEAAALTRASSRRLGQLKALAAGTAIQLTAAQDALELARAAEAARQARLAAARVQARAARDALQQARHAATIRQGRLRVASSPMSRSRFVAPVGAVCTGGSTAGQANGNLDPAALCPLWQAPGQRLRADAAAAFNRLSEDHAATVGGPLCVTDSYRSYSEQVAVYQSRPGLAAVPGTSEHGWGKATDLCGGIEEAGTAASRWMQANAGRFNFFHPSWAEPSGSKPEPWHWEFNG